MQISSPETFVHTRNAPIRINPLLFIDRKLIRSDVSSRKNKRSKNKKIQGWIHFEINLDSAWISRLEISGWKRDDRPRNFTQANPEALKVSRRFQPTRNRSHEKSS